MKYRLQNCCLNVLLTCYLSYKRHTMFPIMKIGYTLPNRLKHYPWLNSLRSELCKPSGWLEPHCFNVFTEAIMAIFINGSWNLTPTRCRQSDF